MGNRKLTGTWTKYGGGKQAPIKEKVKDEWTCQSCGQVYVREISPYMYEFLEEEYMRVCAVCFNDGCARFHARRLQTDE